MGAVFAKSVYSGCFVSIAYKKPISAVRVVARLLPEWVPLFVDPNRQFPSS
jgi:hypothetical protein